MPLLKKNKNKKNSKSPTSISNIATGPTFLPGAEILTSLPGLYVEKKVVSYKRRRGLKRNNQYFIYQKDVPADTNEQYQGNVYYLLLIKLQKIFHFEFSMNFHELTFYEVRPLFTVKEKNPFSMKMVFDKLIFNSDYYALGKLIHLRNTPYQAKLFIRKIKTSYISSLWT